MAETKKSKQPEAYKRRKADFFGRVFKVTPDVLIPRPETEGMVEMVLSLAGQEYLYGVKVPPRVLPARPKILDVGTGSGCVAVTLKLELLDSKVLACDISDKALGVARFNAKKMGARVDFVKSDLLQNVQGKFDVVVANLQYVDRSWEWLDKEALGFEPELALYAGDRGLEVIFRLLRQVRGRTKYLILEADPCQHERIVKEAKSQGFENLEIRGYQLLFGIRG